MSHITVNLSVEELAAVSRAARRLRVEPDAIVYAALDRMMLQMNDPSVRAEVARSNEGRGRALPRWSDQARSVHAYESQTDDESKRSDYLRVDEW
ncbi:MAG: hypothetical protein ACREFX_05865 [Opitutaceae bacterium]